MGAQASEEIDRWVSVSDLALATRRMRVVTALPSECQVEVLRVLWRSLRYVPAGEILVTPSQTCDRMFVVARGEAEVLLSTTDYIPLLPEGAFVCEAALLGSSGGQPSGEGCASSAAGWHGLSAARPRRLIDPVWSLRRTAILPRGPLGIIAEFLVKPSTVDGPRFPGKLRTTRRSLMAELTREEFRSILRAHGADVVQGFADMPATCNALQNVTVFGVEAQTVNANDIAARVVCEGPIHASCQSGLRVVRQGLLGSCMHPTVVESEFER